MSAVVGGGERGKGLPAEPLQEGGVAGCSRLRKKLASRRRKLPDIPEAMQSFVEITVCEDRKYNPRSWRLRGGTRERITASVRTKKWRDWRAGAGSSV